MLYKKILTLYSIILITFICYWFGVSGPLLLDDFSNLETLGYYGGVIDWESAQRFVFSNGSGPLGRPVAMATFLLNDFSWPAANVAGFKLTNVAFHLCTGLLLFLLVNRLLQQEFKFLQRRAELFALVVMAIWLLHPIHASTVLYVIQRMTILSALFSLAAFLCYVQFRYYYRLHFLAKSSLSVLLGVFFFLLAIFSKENALLLIPFILICELFILQGIMPVKLKRLGRTVTYTVFLSSPLWLYMTYDIWGVGYAIRDFNLTERLILQVAVLGDYLSKLIFPTVGNMNLFNERFTALSISFSNIAFIKGRLFSFALLFLSLYAVYKKNRLLVFGLTWFLCFHLMESTIFPLEIYFEHRNYLPSIGIFIGLISLVNDLQKKLSSFLVPSVIVVLFLIYLLFSNLILSKTWGDPANLFIKFSGDQPSSIRAKSTYATYLENLGLHEFALSEIDAAMQIRPDLLSLALNKLRLICEYELEADKTKLVDEILSATYFETGALFQLKRIISMPSDKCVLLVNNRPILEQIFENIESMKGFGLRSTVVAQYYFLKTDYYINKRMFESAMEAINTSIEFTPTVDLLLKKTVMLTSAGLYEHALISAKIALEKDKNRELFIPSRSDEIEYVIMSLNNQLAIQK
jgi:tetratricopeptide (TPR) repeat protein